MTIQSASRARGVLLLTLVMGVLVAFSGSASAYWLETQLAGIRLGDSAFVLYENPYYGEPEAIVIATSGGGEGPATSEGFPGDSLGGVSSGEGAVGGGGAAGPGVSTGGPEGPFGGPMGGPMGMSGPPMMGGQAGGPMMGPMMPSMGMMGYVPGSGEGTQIVMNPGEPGMASGFWGTSRPGTLNVQSGPMGPMMGGSRPPTGGAGTGGGGALAGPPMIPGAEGGMMMGPGSPSLPSSGGFMGFQGPGAAPGAAAGGFPGAGGGGSVSGFPVWALSVWFDLRQNEMEYFYMVKDVAVGFVINKIDGKIVAISVAGEACDFARSAMWKPHEYVQLGDSFKQVQYRYGWPHEIETFAGSGNPLATPLSGTSVTFGNNTNEYRRDCILWYHEVRGEKQCNVAFTLHDFLVTRMHIWIPEPI